MNGTMNCNSNSNSNLNSNGLNNDAILSSPQQHFAQRVRVLQGENASLREQKGAAETKLDRAYLQLDRVFHCLNDNLERATEAMIFQQSHSSTTGMPIVEELLHCQAVLQELKTNTTTTTPHAYDPNNNAQDNNYHELQQQQQQ